MLVSILATASVGNTSVSISIGNIQLLCTPVNAVLN